MTSINTMHQLSYRVSHGSLSWFAKSWFEVVLNFV